MAGTSETSSFCDSARGHRVGLVERACRAIVASYPDGDGTNVSEGIAGGDCEAIAAAQEQRRDVRALIGTILFAVALLLYGALLAGIDAAEYASRQHEYRSGTSLPETTETGCYYAATAVLVAVRGGS